MVVRDPDVKHQLARLNRQAWSVYRRLGAKRARREASMRKIVDAVQWQADHFEEVPVVVVPCLHGRAPVFGSPVIAASYYGSIFPAVQNLLLAARAVGLGATLTTLPSGRSRWRAVPWGYRDRSPRWQWSPWGGRRVATVPPPADRWKKWYTSTVMAINRSPRTPRATAPAEAE